MLSILDTGKELDEKATIRNVREFFNKELPIIKARAHLLLILGLLADISIRSIPNKKAK